LVAVLALAGSAAYAQGEYSEPLLGVKKMFADNEITALAEPFVGVRTTDGIQTGLYSIEATGVPMAPIRNAAVEFIESLSHHQKLKTEYALQDPEWRRWSNVSNAIYVRRGTSIAEMNAKQKKAAFGLMSASLSERGYELSRGIMKTDQTLSEINPGALGFGEELYFLTMMGKPSATEPWGWQMEGHHLVLNFLALADQAVLSPVFVGGEPMVTETGKYAGNELLQIEQNAGLELAQSFNAEQRGAAILAADKAVGNMLAASGQDNLVLDYEGIATTQMSAAQKEDLRDLIGRYVGILNEGHAQVRMDEIEEHFDATYFAWIGDTSDDAVFYYRIHSPVILIEFDHQQPFGLRSLLPSGVPTRQHIHVMIRTPNGNDYGKDLLRQHLETHPH